MDKKSDTQNDREMQSSETKKACEQSANDRGYEPAAEHRCDQSGSTGTESSAQDKEWIARQNKANKGKSKEEGGGGYDGPGTVQAETEQR